MWERKDERCDGFKLGSQWFSIGRAEWLRIRGLLRVPLRLKWHRARQPKVWTGTRASSALAPLNMAVEPPIATARTQTRWAPCTAHWDTFNDYMPLTSRQTILLLRLFNPLLDKNVAQSSHIRRLKGSLEYDSRRLIMHNRVTREHLVHSLTAQSTSDIPRPTKKKNVAL